ncbi:MAG: SsrA-binding protein SmpB [Acidimicrobiales bacterium]|nr:SsrA-binding protein SmpB [Acidimicrobiales bacterium]
MRPTGTKVVATNRQGRRNYAVLDTVEAGLVLRGSEVKSLREAKVQISDSFARIDGGEVWLHALHIAPYAFSQTHTGHDPERKRKLLLNKQEIERLRSRVDPEQLSLIPMSIYFKDGRAKVELALAKGRNTYDKRRVLAERDASLSLQRARRGERDE